MVSIASRLFGFSERHYLLLFSSFSPFRSFSDFKKIWILLCNAFFSPRQFIILWTHTTVEYWERCYFVNIFIGMCSKVYLFMAVLCWFLFPMWCVLYHFSIKETNGMFRPRLIPFPNRHHVSKNRRRTHNEHAYFVSVSGMCHRRRKLSPKRLGSEDV